MMLIKTDVDIIRELAARVAHIAALPVQEEKRTMWRRLNSLQPVRPMVMIDQVCWHEMNTGGELSLQCSDRECRCYEETLRRTLYQWKHFPVDMVVERHVKVPKAILNSGFGMNIMEETAVSDPSNSVVSHQYENQFQTEDDLEKIGMPAISHDTTETRRRLEDAHELFDGLLDVVPWGAEPYGSFWDPISQWMGVEAALYMLVDNPDFMHRLLARMTNGYLSAFDQLEAQGLLCGHQSLIHCTGAYTDALPAAGYNPAKPRTKDLWIFGLAQMLATVSPDMFKEFEVDYARRICERFGLVYYGCCDPLDGKMAEVRLIPNVRKISMSPWVNEERGAAEIRGDYVYSRKPNPAFLATNHFSEEQIGADLLASKKACENHGCPLEFILKDISTLNHEPDRLSEWARIAMKVVREI